MIKELNIKNFKCHRDVSLQLRPLTLLTGTNSSGKTSVIQSLLLLRQSYKKGVLNKGLDLIGSLCKVGTATDALCNNPSNGIISYEIKTDNSEILNFEFCTTGRMGDSFIPKLSTSPDIAGLCDSLGLFTNDFQYISAARWGGISEYPKDSYLADMERQISAERGQGELVANFLYVHGEEKPIVCESDNEEHNLLGECIYWERLISKGVSFDVVPSADGKMFSVNYKYDEEGAESINDLRAENIGYGISYSLPVIVALLSAKPGSLIIIENPEAHLHPGAQSHLMKLVSLVASQGVQVIIETHSDHIINAALLSLHNGSMTQEDVSVYYFDNPDKSLDSNANLLEVSKTGRIKYPPKGFFDQMDNDLQQLLGF